MHNNIIIITINRPKSALTKNVTQIFLLALISYTMAFLLTEAICNWTNIFTYRHWNVHKLTIKWTKNAMCERKSNENGLYFFSYFEIESIRIESPVNDESDEWRLSWVDLVHALNKLLSIKIQFPFQNNRKS